MAGNDMSTFLRNDRGVTVVFGTLLLILITIIAATSVAYMISTTQKQAMDLESHKASVENEDLKIVSIDPVGDGSNWESIDLKVLNLNTADSYISAINVNGGYFLHYKAYESEGVFDVYRDYPAVYSANHKVVVPATRSKTIHLNFSDMVLEGSETIDTSSWTNNSLDHSYTLDKHPWYAFGEVAYDYHVNYSSNGTECLKTGNFSIDDENREITLFGSGSGGNLTNNTDYDIFYKVYLTSYAGSSPSESDPIKVEIITSYINVFKELFTPPMPVAEVQFKVEYLQNANGTQTPNSYLILDASDSQDVDGFITSYKWAVWKDSGNGTVTLYDYDLSGMVVRPIGIDPYNDKNVTIDLEITDDDGMTSRLGQVSGNLTIL
ncbi:archaellin/type IV pilin N-terminal domain-containing protein [Methanolobus profundi]|nr:archaellin/type IV pilin N-terminal domain-containing protein [Methanolobus profundi]